MLALQFLVCTALFLGVAADFTHVAGYHPTGDVTAHSMIDLDIQQLQNHVDSSNFTGAYKWYSEGGNSLKTSGATRTVQGFSTSSDKLQDEPWYQVFRDYYNDDEYADTYTRSACLGTGDFSESTSPSISDTARAEGCEKGAQYLVVWYYVVHEMEEGIEDCKANINGIHWDEAVAFYTGSIPGEDGFERGVLNYGLAEKRADNFGTATAADDDVGYDSLVNQKVFSLFENGRDFYIARDCTNMEATKDKIVHQMMIPLIQGTLRYLYFADTTETEKARAELSAFSSAMLPIVDFYSPAAAQSLADNSAITSTNIVPNGYASVKANIETTYADMGLTCAEVGGLVSNTYQSGYYPGMEPCVDASTSSSGSSEAMPAYGIALLVIFLVIAVGAAIFGAYHYSKSRQYSHMLSERENMMNVNSGSSGKF
jgi:hypothetical protein